jgi:ribosomal protein L1
MQFLHHLKDQMVHQTYSGKGYIIPNDLTETQKRNVQTLINQLKAKNSFRNDDTV